MKIKPLESRNQSENLVFSRIVVIGMAIALAGCSSMERSVMLGVGMGTGAGATVGLMTRGKDKTEATLIAAGIGAVVGGIASYVIHGSLDRRDDTTRRDTLFNLENHGLKNTAAGNTDLSDVGGFITMPEVEEDWVETHTEGNKMVEGHRVWRITNGARWDLSRKPEKKRKK